MGSAGSKGPVKEDADFPDATLVGPLIATFPEQRWGEARAALLDLLGLA
jgi:hypothetical protein